MATRNFNKPADAAPADPQAGGRYLRNADGTLTLVDQTEDGRRRAPRAGDGTPAAAAPAATPEQLPE